MPLHPTQLYEAVGELAIFGLLVLLERRQDRRAPPSRPGRLFLAYVASYAALRFVVELFRGDAARGHVVSWTAPRLAAALGLPPEHALLLSTSQLASVIALLLVGVAAYRRRRSRRETPAAP